MAAVVEKITRERFVPVLEKELELRKTIFSAYEAVHQTKPPPDPLKYVKAGDVISVGNEKAKTSMGFIKTDESNYKPLWALETTASDETRLIWPKRNLLHDPNVSMDLSVQTDKIYGTSLLNIRNKDIFTDLCPLPFDKISHFKPKSVELPGFYIQRNKYDKAKTVASATSRLLITISGLNITMAVFELGANNSNEKVLFLCIPAGLASGLMFALFYADNKIKVELEKLGKILTGKIPELGKYFTKYEEL